MPRSCGNPSSGGTRRLFFFTGVLLIAVLLVGADAIPNRQAEPAPPAVQAAAFVGAPALQHRFNAVIRGARGGSASRPRALSRPALTA